MGLLDSVFRLLGRKERPVTVTDRTPAQADVPLGALEIARDRAVDAIASRGDLDATAKASAAANIKGIYYMMVAARDLARSDDRESAAQIRMLLDRAASGTASFTRDLRRLGEEGEVLARGLEAAFTACRDTIAARLPPR